MVVASGRHRRYRRLRRPVGAVGPTRARAHHAAQATANPSGTADRAARSNVLGVCPRANQHQGGYWCYDEYVAHGRHIGCLAVQATHTKVYGRVAVRLRSCHHRPQISSAMLAECARRSLPRLQLPHRQVVPSRIGGADDATTGRFDRNACDTLQRTLCSAGAARTEENQDRDEHTRHQCCLFPVPLQEFPVTSKLNPCSLAVRFVGRATES
jgi:hypothetical protein